MNWNPGDLTVTSGGAPRLASGGGLASHVFDAEGTQHVFYPAANSDVIELWWRGGDAARWGDLSFSSTAPSVALPAGLASHVFDAEGTQHVFYRAGLGHVVEMWWRGGDAVRWGDLTGSVDEPHLAAGDPTSHVFDAEGTQHVFYRSFDGHIMELWWRGGQAAQLSDLTERSGTRFLAAGNLASHVVSVEGTQHVFFRSTEGHVVELWWGIGQRPQPEDLTDRSGAPLAAGDPVSHVASDGTQHVFYVDVDDQLIDVWWGLGQPKQWRNRTQGRGGADLPISRPTSYPVAADGTQHVVYSGADLLLRHLDWRGDEPPSFEVLTDGSLGTPRALGDPTSHAFPAENTQHVFYATGEDHIIELWTKD